MRKLLHYTEDELARKWCGMHGLASMWEAPDSASWNLLKDNVKIGLRAWYTRLLREAPGGTVPVRDLWTKVDVCEPIAHSGYAIELPSEGYRTVAVQMEEWAEPVWTFHPLLSAAHRRQSSPLRRSTPSDPVAVHTGNLLLLYGFDRVPEKGTLPMKLLMTARPDDGSYEFEAGIFPGPEILRDFMWDRLC